MQKLFNEKQTRLIYRYFVHSDFIIKQNPTNGVYLETSDGFSFWLTPEGNYKSTKTMIVW